MQFNKIIPHLVALGVFFVVLFVAFGPAFSGEAIQQGDKLSHLALTGEMQEYGEEVGGRVLWTNKLFGGMPTYQISAIKDGNLVDVVREVFTGFVLPYPADIFLAAMLCMYLALLLMGVNPWISIAGAVAYGLLSNNFILFETGHNTKIKVYSYLPMVVAGIVLAWRKRYLLGAVIFALGMALVLLSNHVQMLYYFGLTVPVFGLAMIAYTVRSGDWTHFGKTIGYLSLALLLSLGAGASNVLPTLEYGEQTMRGEPILANDNDGAAAAPSSSSETDGLEWTYAMNWSNNFEDVIATMIPRAAGGGSGENISRDTPFGAALSRGGARIPAEFMAPTYHGGQPFTSGPRYQGAVIWFLFFLGLVALSGPVKWWFGLGMLFSVFMSMGSYAEGFNRFLFETVPLFNKWRAPSSVFDVAGVLSMSLAFLGLHAWMKQRKADPETAKKQLFLGGGLALGLTAFLWALGPSLFDFAGSNDAASLQRMLGQADPGLLGRLENALVDTRIELFRADALRSLLFMALTGAALFLYQRGTLKVPLLAAAIGLLAAVDFIGINGRYLDGSEWNPKRKMEQTIPATQADRQIMADPDPHFRVFNTTPSDPFQDAMTSLYHKSVGGYHPAKLQRFEDLKNRHLTRGNQAVFNMLNTKYYIVNGSEGPEAQRNPNALGNAWLVRNIQRVASPNAEIDALGGSFDPATTAVIHEDFLTSEVANLNPNGQGSIRLTNYNPVDMTYAFESQSDQLAVFSETWYGPDAGWKATIDGEPAELIRVNYILRGLVVPAGKHEIKMVFEPSSYGIGYLISLLSSGLILAGLLFLGYRKYRKLAANTPLATDPLDQPTATPTTTPPAAPKTAPQKAPASKAAPRKPKRKKRK